MNGYQNPYMNPYGMQQTGFQQQIPQPYTIGPQMQVTKVNGENGARSFQIGANSSALLLDENGMLVWLVTSDGAGYKTVTPYDIVPHKDAPAPDWSALESRITKLEESIYAAGTTNSSATRKKSNVKPDDGED